MGFKPGHDRLDVVRFRLAIKTNLNESKLMPSDFKKDTSLYNDLKSRFLRFIY